MQGFRGRLASGAVQNRIPQQPLVQLLADALQHGSSMERAMMTMLSSVALASNHNNPWSTLVR